jgi:hypothetical protein
MIHLIISFTAICQLAHLHAANFTTKPPEFRRDFISSFIMLDVTSYCYLR